MLYIFIYSFISEFFIIIKYFKKRGDILSLFKDMFNDFLTSLSDKEINIFNFISSNFISVSKMNIKELSLKLNVTEYSINKFCKKINIDNFDNLTSVLKELSKSSIGTSNHIFKNSIEIFSKFLNNINESQIIEICKLILENKSVSILYSESSKLIAQYLGQNLEYLGIESKTTYSVKQILRQTNIQLVIYITTSLEESTIENRLKYLNNKTVVVISDTMIKKIHDAVSLFIYIENSKLFKNFNVYSNSLYFIFSDLLISKLIELINNKI